MLSEDDNQFLVSNSLPLAELLTFADFAKNMAIAFVEDLRIPAESLVKILQEDSRCENIQFVVFDFLQQPELRFLYQELKLRLSVVNRQQGKKLVLVLQGLEQSTNNPELGTRMLADLNFMRDFYPKGVPYPILFVLPGSAVMTLAKVAPDFWDWRSGVFSFSPPPPPTVGDGSNPRAS